ncbi:hypothetical protein ERO13_D11G171250v2 [Gossypium hirsutum]|uniref:Uncharacterized protein n=2 Tax=Gossypium TaxID=3633 RepID=A0A5J5PGC5_GOSBA|nr:hypothetical protein ES319_D11G180800v1 [Gossypium barbadense]KAG4120895.1 hypothetical protein ERO13_D11G171250v2 [Gossypium hirsutum]TYG45647.1 hypothetical protein ES288_D11G191100v1 [Gossypium darwinii]
MAVDSEPNENFETEDYEKVHIVQPWTMDFNLMQPYSCRGCFNSNVFKARIRLPGLLGFLYKRKILEEIGGMVGKVSKIDFNTDSRMRGKFARMKVYVEFESLTVIFFGCGRYDHLKDVCLNQPNMLGHGTGFGTIEKEDLAANSPIFVHMEQRAVALEVQPSGILDLNMDSNMWLSVLGV